MGDRCWISITFRKKDQKKIEEEFFFEELDEDNTIFTGYECDVNYGGFDGRERLAEESLTFYGFHGAGVGYGERAFACYKGKQVEINADYDGNPVASVLPDGTIPKIERDDAIEFWKIYKQAKEYVYGKQNNKAK